MIAYASREEEGIWNTVSKLFEEFPHVKKRYWGRGYFCATSGQITDEMIKSYLEHHFEPSPDESIKVEE
jgi:putative transposase